MKKVVYGVRFDGYLGKTYSFVGKEGINVGDTVVVDTVNGLQIATVTEVDYKGACVATKWIVANFNLEEFKAFLEREEKKEALKEKMYQKYIEKSNMELFAKMAENDSEMKEMLDEYSELDNAVQP